MNFPPVNHSSFFGMDVVVHEGIPKYQLPEEILPGLPWPPGFREEINTWALASFGRESLIPKGEVWMIQGKVTCSRETFELLKIINIKET